MKATFYGVRGSIATPLTPQSVTDKVEEVVKEVTTNENYKGKSVDEIMTMLPFHLKSTIGGNTLCIFLEIGEHKIILDCGSGMRELGNRLLGSEFGKGQGHAKVFISHTHWDHIQGLCFFVPIFIPGNRFDFYSIIPDLEDRFRYQQQFKFFPVNLDYMQGSKQFFPMKINEERDFGDFTVRMIRQTHPGGTVGYRFEADGKVLVYATDVEFNYKNMDEISAAVEFYRNADVLILDTQYTLNEQIEKIDWGHSSLQIGIDITEKANVKKLILWHHDPMCSDKKMTEILELGRSYKKNQFPDSKFEIIPSYEGLVIDI